jgi:phenylpropionate dioxygenase-like ring-hydroxylating dioxygenase large terminal subunit
VTIGYTGAADIGELLDPEQGLVSRHVFSDPGIYRLEQERIFARCWQFIGHESQIPVPGDFVSAYLGEDPVLVVRRDDGGIAGFLNVRPHSGTRIRKLDAGNAPGLSSGAAVPIAQVDSYKGLIFGTFDPDAPPLVDYLGDFAYHLDVLVDRRDGGTELIGGPNRWIMEANWKFGAENFVQDGHHSFASHVSALMAMQDGDEDITDFPGGCTFRAGGGHGGGWFAADTLALVARDPALLAYHRDVVRPESARRLGIDRDPIHNIGVGTIFPNFSYLTGVQTIRVWLPRGPDHMEVRSWTIVDREAPAEIKDAQLRFVRTTFSPSGLLEQDDGENWAMCQDTLRGHVSRQLDTNVRMGMGQPIDADAAAPGQVMHGWNEEPGRGFFARYGQLMADPTARVWSVDDGDGQ